jgi:hypothetical protein
MVPQYTTPWLTEMRGVPCMENMGVSVHNLNTQQQQQARRRQQQHEEAQQQQWKEPTRAVG